MRTYAIGEREGEYLIVIDNDNKVTVVDRENNRIDVTDDNMIRALLYTLEFYKEQHEFAGLRIESLENEIHYHRSIEAHTHDWIVNSGRDD